MIRILDIILSGLALVLLAPLLLSIMIILKLTGEHEVFYFQERIGKDGKPFYLWKFATMISNSQNMEGGYITTKNDSRVLPFGKFLRKSKINELPQLINILIGDMSVVGPRPKVNAHLAFYPQETLDEILSIKPGLTGIASLFFRDEESMIAKSTLPPSDFYQSYIGPYKSKLEIWYLSKKSIYMYIKIIALTAWSVVFPRSQAYRKIFKDLPEAPKELLIA